MSNIRRMNYPSLGKSLEDIGKVSWEVDMRRGGWVITCLHIFSMICAIFEI